MISQKVIWWTIVIILAIIIIWYFGKEEENTGCCTFNNVEPNVADGISTLTYCKRSGKYYVSGTGGITGTIPEKEISERELNAAWANGKCVRTT